MRELQGTGERQRPGWERDGGRGGAGSHGALDVPPQSVGSVPAALAGEQRHQARIWKRGPHLREARRSMKKPAPTEKSRGLFNTTAIVQAQDDGASTPPTSAPRPVLSRAARARLSIILGCISPPLETPQGPFHSVRGQVLLLVYVAGATSPRLSP